MATATGTWVNGLFDCFDNLGLCVMAYFAPCVIFGRNAESMDVGGCLLCGAAFFIPILNIIEWLEIRKRIREDRGIEGTTCNDLLTILCCSSCALVQEAVEITYIPSTKPLSRE